MCGNLFMTRPVSLSTSSFFVGQIGSKIGTLSCGGLTGTYEITDAKWKHNGSQLDSLLKEMISTLPMAGCLIMKVVGSKGDYFGTWWALGNSLNIKFTSDRWDYCSKLHQYLYNGR